VRSRPALLFYLPPDYHYREGGTMRFSYLPDAAAQALQAHGGIAVDLARLAADRTAQAGVTDAGEGGDLPL
jgi:hypothetical protein